VQKRLTIPEISGSTLRELLGPLFTSDHETQLRGGKRIEATHALPDGSGFLAVFTLRGSSSAETLAFDVVFSRGSKRPAVTAPAPFQVAAGSLASAPSSTVSAPAQTSVESPVIVQAPMFSSGAEHNARELPRARPRLPRQGATDLSSSAPLVSLLATAVAMRASDLHLLDGELPSLRINGALRELSTIDPTVFPVYEPSQFKVAGLLASAFGLAERDLEEGLDSTLEVPSLGRFRVHCYLASRGLAAAIRMLPKAVPRVGELKFPVRIDDLVDLPHGLVLVCGPTGAGKSTTLAALGQEAIRRYPKMLITLEDPIEYVLEPGTDGGLVRQRQVGRDVRDFNSGLKEALREDPDVILLGELRDAETIMLALTAAETGHLVLATLHSRSASSAVERIIDAVPAARQNQVRAQLADSLRAVIVQRLIPRMDGSGRTPAVEILRGNIGVAALIREGKNSHLITTIQSGRREGMIPMDRCLADLVKSGAISVADAQANASDPTSLTQFLQ
ncbi:MAG: PilT/PilU family type 4a pilus ATPase, partial [Polyangiaceae bacterium]